MTYQDCIWKGKYVWIVSIMSKNKRMHRYLKKYVGHGGFVLGTAKNNMLLVEFTYRNKNRERVKELRSIPSSCVVEYGTVKSGY